ncbi:class I SAM-dependent methyltransferase [Novosphingobium lentum]|uniref:class I SAM-dependent methyltransferase n=1 Tax=Novosphingobium lentum TaxID=145287 RepID=UPI00082E3239|nr:class I SAM-dependent methyltransferase [Novosphingobium lentum]
MERLDEIKSAFSGIYENNVWGKGSGTGSMPIYNLNYIHFISNFMKWNNIKSVLDYGCGDWQFSRFINWEGIDYTGVDVVEQVIEDNKRDFQTANVKFMTYDSMDELPEVDLVISKDVMQHLPVEVIKHSLGVLKTKSKMMVITNDIFPDKWVNVDINPGEGRAIRLTDAPFSMGAAVIYRESFIAYEVFVEKEACLILGDRA